MIGLIGQLKKELPMFVRFKWMDFDREELSTHTPCIHS